MDGPLNGWIGGLKNGWETGGLWVDGYMN